MVNGPLLKALRRRPNDRGALRVAFVGQGTFFEACSLVGVHGAVHGHFVDFRLRGDAGVLAARLDDLDPDVVVAFRPETIPAGAFADLRATAIGFLTEPIPRGPQSVEDQQRRLWELQQVDAANFDRVVAFDPLIVETAEQVLPVWRSLALPVNDRFYADVRPIEGRPRLLFVGRSTPHREALLTPVKHEYDLMHLAFGVDADELERVLSEHEVGINVHNDKYPSFENRVLLHLAAGHLVLTEALSPLHGLEPGIDVVQFFHSGHLLWACDRLVRFPTIYDRVRIRGRLKAEQYRASRVWPRIIGDAFADIAAFGSPRRAQERSGSRSTTSRSNGARSSRSETTSSMSPGQSIASSGSR